MTTNLQRYNMRSRYTTANVITRLIKLKDLHTCAKTVNSLCYAALYKRPCHMHTHTSGNSTKLHVPNNG